MEHSNLTPSSRSWASSSHIWSLGIGAWLLSVALAVGLGAVAGADFDLIFSIRLPRVILATVVGMGLAVAGTALQAIFSNPLCEPYTLGISSGSALGAAIGLTLGIQWNVGGFVGTAFLGALVFTAILLLVTRRNILDSSSLLLVGVLLGFLGTSLIALWIALNDSNDLSRVLTWLFGDLSRARWQGSLSAGFGVFGLSIAIWRYWRELDALLMGEEDAQTLGVNVPQVRQNLVFLTSLLVAICVSFAGMIGFLGLVVPHFARRWVGSLHWKLLPFAAICGATTLILSDLLSRTLIRPYELPVGVITALLGVPIFLLLIVQRNAWQRNT